MSVLVIAEIDPAYDVSLGNALHLIDGAKAVPQWSGVRTSRPSMPATVPSSY